VFRISRTAGPRAVAITGGSSRPSAVQPSRPSANAPFGGPGASVAGASVRRASGGPLTAGAPTAGGAAPIATARTIGTARREIPAPG
jgi:hypothetical protein